MALSYRTILVEPSLDVHQICFDLLYYHVWKVHYLPLMKIAHWWGGRGPTLLVSYNIGRGFLSIVQWQD